MAGLPPLHVPCRGGLAAPSYPLPVPGPAVPAPGGLIGFAFESEADGQGSMHLLRVHGTDRSIRVYVTHDLTSVHSEVHTAIVVIHGARRNAWAYFKAMRAGLATSGRLSEGVSIVAPGFLIQHDGPLPEELYWDRTNGGP